MGILGLEDDEFWSNPTRTQLQTVGELVRERRLGVRLDGPRQVDLALRSSLPIAVLNVETEAQRFRHCFDNEAILVAARLEDRALLVSRLSSPVPFEPKPGGRESVCGNLRIVDAVRKLGISAKPAEYRIGLIVRDTISERLEIQVGESKLGYEDEAIAEFLAAQPPPPPPPVWPAPGRPYPNYRLHKRSPPTPAEPGIALAAPRVVVQGRDRAILRGSYRLAVTTRDRVLERRKEDDPAAILPITLLINGSRDPGPVVLALRVPVDESALRGDQALGHFALDLFDYPPLGRREQTLFVWALCGEQMSGPTHIGIVSEDSLPGRY